MRGDRETRTVGLSLGSVVLTVGSRSPLFVASDAVQFPIDKYVLKSTLDPIVWVRCGFTSDIVYGQVPTRFFLGSNETRA